eukprot:214329_1
MNITHTFVLSIHLPSGLMEDEPPPKKQKIESPSHSSSNSSNSSSSDDDVDMAELSTPRPPRIPSHSRLNSPRWSEFHRVAMEKVASPGGGVALLPGVASSEAGSSSGVASSEVGTSSGVASSEVGTSSGVAVKGVAVKGVSLLEGVAKSKNSGGMSNVGAPVKTSRTSQREPSQPSHSSNASEASTIQYSTSSSESGSESSTQSNGKASAKLPQISKSQINIGMNGTTPVVNGAQSFAGSPTLRSSKHRPTETFSSVPQCDVISTTSTQKQLVSSSMSQDNMAIPSIPQHVPTHSMSQHVPTPSMSQHVPTPSMSQHVPTPSMSQHVPTSSPSQHVDLTGPHFANSSQNHKISNSNSVNRSRTVPDTKGPLRAAQPPRKKHRKLRLYLDNDETLCHVKMEGDLPPHIRRLRLETCRRPYGPDGKHTLFVKLRDGVMKGLPRLAKYYDLVICSTGETDYIEIMKDIFDPENVLNMEIVAADHNPKNDPKSVHKPLPIDASRCLALDNLELWAERDLLVVAPVFEYWNMRVVQDAELQDNFWPVFEEIAICVHRLVCAEPRLAQSTAEALKIMRRSVFHGKCFRILGARSEQQTATLRDLGAACLDRRTPWGTDPRALSACIVLRPDLFREKRRLSAADQKERQLVLEEIKRAGERKIFVVTWEYVRQSYYQYWAADLSNFAWPGLKFNYRASGFCDTRASHSKRYERARAIVEGGGRAPPEMGAGGQPTTIPSSASPPPIPTAFPESSAQPGSISGGDLHAWYQSRLGPIPPLSLTHRQVEPLNPVEVCKLLMLAWTTPGNAQTIRHLLRVGVDPNTKIFGEFLPVLLLSSKSESLRKVVVEFFPKIDINIVSQSGRSLLAVSLIDGRSADVAMLLMRAKKFNFAERIFLDGKEFSLCDYHIKMNRSRMSSRDYQNIIMKLNESR